MMRHRTQALVVASAMALTCVAPLVGAAAVAGAVTDSAKTPYKIGLANTYIANAWRVEMENLLKVGAATPPYNHEVKLTIDNTANTVSDQIAAIQDMINAGYNAILIDAASPGALNPVIAKAHAKGIVVVAFDNTVTSPYAYNVNVLQAPMGSDGATWLVKELHGKGNIIMNRGIAGSPVDIARYNAAIAVFKKYPGIKIVDQIYGQWDDATTEAGFLSALPSFPNVNGIWSEGASGGAINAFVKLHRKFVPTMTGTENNEFLDFIKYRSQGLVGLSVGNSPGMSAVALKVAVNLLQGKKEPKFTVIPINLTPSSQAKIGVNAFPNQPGTLEVNWQVPGFNFNMKEAITGKLS